ncbi:efflux transporter outer membrane subunit [Vibrio comitans]|uniref:Outer membrane protein n=1 Tax=Vibrio comitans NBRC 102076 TaxID=1219078 RepID=A0A4Y3IS06_9VIBR|nr:efflux transporter outer membrane subunit [Vibrio comitans]GEA62293.1 outer membrane protein [Vibrio comitans NBRC 102076]
MLPVRSLMVMSILASVVGCSMTPEVPQDYVNFNQTYLYDGENIETGGEVDTNWWEAFDDPLLSDLVQKAQHQNISLKVAAENITMAQAYHSAVSSLKVPSIDVGFGYGHIGLSENEAFTGQLIGASVMGRDLVDSSAGNFLTGVSVSWEADLFGRVSAMSDAAEVRASQAELTKDGVTIAITAEVLSNYFEMRSAQQRQNIVQVSIERQHKSLARVEHLRESGIASHIEVSRSRTMLAQTQAILPQLETAENVHKHRLAILLGEHNAEFFESLKATETFPSFTGVVPMGLPSELLQRRPDVKSAELEILAQNHQVGSAVAAKYPSFYLSGSPGLVAQNFEDLFSSDSLAWSVGGGIKWNLFDGGRKDALLSIQEANLESALLRYQGSVNTAISEVEILLSAYDDSRQYHKRISEAQEYGEQAYVRAQALYRSGLINQIELIDAQRQLLLLDEQELLARAQTAQLVVQLHKALGGSWNAQESS